MCKFSIILKKIPVQYMYRNPTCEMFGAISVADVSISNIHNSNSFYKDKGHPNKKATSSSNSWGVRIISIYGCCHCEMHLKHY